MREREQGGREARCSLEVATVALHSGGIEGAWVATGREGGREGGRSSLPVAQQKVQARVQAIGAAARREGRVEMEMRSR